MSPRRTSSIAALCLLASLGAAPAPPAGPDVAGDWILTTMVFTEPLDETLTLKVDNGKLTGTDAGRDVTGELKGDVVRFQYKDGDGTVNAYEGRVK